MSDLFYYFICVSDIANVIRVPVASDEVEIQIPFKSACGRLFNISSNCMSDCHPSVAYSSI